MHTFDDLRRYVIQYYGEHAWDAFNPKDRDRDLSIDVLARKFFSQLPTRTRMFREYVENTFNQYIFPRMRQSSSPTILSLPCSNGEEAYTLAMLALDSRTYLNVYGMDINPGLIEAAASGRLSVPWARMKSLDDQVEKRYIMKRNRFPNVIVAQHVKDRCEFFVHDILTGPPSGIFDAVYCLNLFCYLTEQGREEALNNLIASMESGSVLVVDEPYSVPPPSTMRGQPRYNGRDELQYGWKVDLNEFLATLHEKEFGLRRISPNNSSFNVYEKI